MRYISDHPKINHGTITGYKDYKCRCDDCTKANTEYARKLYHQNSLTSKKKFKWYTKEEISSWPEEHKPCRGCNKILPFKMFHNDKKLLFGLASHCKNCIHLKSVKDYSEKTREKKIHERAKSRANKKGWDFNIDVSDIILPEYCPVLGIPLENSGDYSPSIDRINSFKGYIKGNICIMSYRANVLKNNATPEELIAIAHWLQKQQSDLI